MFSVSFRRFCYITDKIIVRNLRSKRFVPEANSGLQKRLEVFQKEGLKIEDDDAEEFVEESASDFYEVGQSYRRHMKETKDNKINLQHHIIKQKYFKQNLPNFLTWSEKEQIRHLAMSEPDEWTLEKLAESFPVTVPVVKKLLKYDWKPATKDRIDRHDASAMRNWRELKEGTLNIPEELRQHFLKFSERTIPPLIHKPINIDITPKDTKMGEFEQIVRRCAIKDEHPDRTVSSDDSQESFIGNKTKPIKTGNKKITLEELKAKIQKRLNEQKEVDMKDQILLQTTNSQESLPAQIQNVSEEIELAKEESKPSEIASFKEEVTAVDYKYMKRIRIPKKAYKKGATYKINDCYYDDDGTFLYRVLGMTE